jgi:hypothetical protein
MSAVPTGSRPWLLESRDIYLKRFESGLRGFQPDSKRLIEIDLNEIPIRRTIYDLYVNAYQAMRENDRQAESERNTTAYPLYEQVKKDVVAYVQLKRTDAASLEKAAQRDVWTAELRNTQDKEKMLFIQKVSIALPPHFKTAALNHSATRPRLSDQ